MAHEIEIINNAPSIFLVGKGAWHGLVNPLQAPPTIEEGIVLAGLNWEVGLKDLFTASQEQVAAQATYRKSDGKILGVVGPDYKPLQNIEAFKFFNPFLQQGLATLEAAASLRGGQRVFVLAKIKDGTADIVNGDPVEAYVLLSNSHDGSLAVRIGFTPIRVVCANTLAMAQDSKASRLIRIKHVGNVAQNLEKVRDIMDLARQEFQTTAESYKLLANTQINQLDLARYVKVIFSDKTDETVTQEAGKRVLGKIIPLFENGLGSDIQGVRGTLWGAYNAVTEYLQHERGKDAEIRLDSTLFGQGASLNKKALQTAITMAKLAA